MGLGAGLNIAVQAMLADETALNTTSNNIANANTPGYSRQVVDFSEAPPVLYGNQLVGNGVEISKIQSQRSSLLQMRLDQETQQQSGYNTYLDAMQQVQTLFNETGGTGLQSSITNFFNSLQQLSNNPADTSLRQGVISAAQSMATTFNNTAAALTTQQQSLNLDVKQNVSDINTITAQIAQLNQQIKISQNASQNSGSLEDQRSQLINQLASNVDISETNAQDGTLTITTSSGAALVVGSKSFDLSTQIDNNTGFWDVYSQGLNITSTINGGSLGASIQVRDTTIPSIASSLDSLASNLESNFNTVNAAGTDLNGDPGTDFFNPPPTNGVGAAAAMTVAITDPSKIAASLDGNAGDNANITAMLALQNQPIVNGQTPMNAYSSLVNQVGNDVATAQAESTGAQSMVTELQNLIGGISGVSINEEAANLVQYQQAYQAAAQVAAVINSLTAIAINLGQTTTVTA